ncbi:MULTISPECIES: TetR/AcrR family transcriptional regulator [unclassified Streptomyces]|uniref:TetR/AcrR family transcriptional regulator n=1 Tax=unclassified Streptomyces TaxID=2593676 RepID=UPI002E31EADC|nr:TetR/AcrR family transcriptional regulator [Streptomyces sp. NBC_01431]
MADGEMGLRERKKRETGMRIWRAALDLFTERGFDHVSVAEIAAAADVSKMTVFNYFGTKEDLVTAPMMHHVGDVVRAVREREPGESAVAAVRRQFLEMIEARDPSVGLNDDPRSLQARQLIMNTPVLLQRASVAFREAQQELAELLAEESGDAMLAAVAAAQLTGARNALITEHHRRILGGESVQWVVTDAAERAERAFAQVENGLGSYPGPA